jgi:enoyl-CoA hydratase
MVRETIEQQRHEEGIVRVSLDRPDRHNAQNPQLIDELGDELSELEADDDVRVIIIDGNGPSFSAGHDLDRGTLEKEWTVEDRLDFEQEYYFERSLEIRDLEKPTIAQVHGYCGAAGMMLMAMCDLAVATSDAQFANPVQRMAATGVELLIEPWEVGFRKAKEYLWTGNKLDATEAHELGMLNRVVSPESIDDEVMTLARKIARMPPFAIRLSKLSFNFTRDQMGERDSHRYQFLAHQLSHASKEWEDWHSEAEEVLKEDGLSGWVNYRDEPFQFDEE